MAERYRLFADREAERLFAAVFDNTVPCSFCSMEISIGDRYCMACGTLSGHFDEEFFVKRWQETLEEAMEECRAGHENERKDRTLTGDLELYAALREVPYCPNCGEIITPRT